VKTRRSQHREVGGRPFTHMDDAVKRRQPLEQVVLDDVVLETPASSRRAGYAPAGTMWRGALQVLERRAALSWSRHAYLNLLAAWVRAPLSARCGGAARA
jgi:hypothetical protein